MHPVAYDPKLPLQKRLAILREQIATIQHNRPIVPRVVESAIKKRQVVRRAHASDFTIGGAA